MAELKSIQLISRTQHTSNSGIEIVRKWHVQPYDAHPEVIKALQGHVEKDGDEFKRVPPSHDPYIENCYCTETLVDFAHPAATATAKDIGKDEDGKALEDPTLLNKLETIKESSTPGSAGAIVTAHYRPLVTAFRFSEDPDTYYDAIWDFMDPVFTPGVRQIPWPDALFVKMRNVAGEMRTDDVPDTVRAPLTVPISDFTIRRILVGEIPWKAIQVCSECVNKETWPGKDHGAFEQLPEFPPRTLKLISATPVNMIDTEGNRWYEITYHFQWIHLFSPDIARESDGQLIPEWVKWGMVYVSPSQLGYPGKTGWYQVFTGKQAKVLGILIPKWLQLPGLALTGGRLYKEVDFDILFE